MEMTYADQEDGGAFKKNVIPELTSLAQENEDFSGEDKKLNGGYLCWNNMDDGSDVLADIPVFH